MAKLVLWLALLAFLLLSFQAAARDLAEATHQPSESFGGAKYPGGGYGGGYPGGGYGSRGGYGGGGYPGGGGGGYPGRGYGGGGYPGGGYGGGGGYCRYGRCCGYYGRCRCCATAAEATAEAAKTMQPHN